MQIAELDAKIEELFSHFNTCITTISGIGPTLGTKIFSEIGDISRFSFQAKLAKFAGIDPTVKQSGEFCRNTQSHVQKRFSLSSPRYMAGINSCCALRSGFESLFSKETRRGQTVYECHRTCNEKTHQYHLCRFA